MSVCGKIYCICCVSYLSSADSGGFIPDSSQASWLADTDCIQLTCLYRLRQGRFFCLATVQAYVGKKSCQRCL